MEHEVSDNELKKEFLREYGKIVRQMERSELKIQEMRASKILPSLINDGMPHGSDQKDLSDYASLLDEEERRYIKYRYQRVKKCKEITDRIERLQNEDEKDILMYRYIKLMKWEDICVKMGYSWRRAHYIHSNALKHFEINLKSA